MDLYNILKGYGYTHAVVCVEYLNPSKKKIRHELIEEVYYFLYPLTTVVKRSIILKLLDAEVYEVNELIDKNVLIFSNEELSLYREKLITMAAFIIVLYYGRSFLGLSLVLMMNRERPNQLKKCRVDLGLTITSLADSVGLAYSTVANLERGRITKRSSKNRPIQKLADFFGVDLLQLCDQ